MTTVRTAQPTTASDQPDDADSALEQLRCSALTTLDILGVPTPPRLLADILAVRGQPVSLKQLARLRHLDRRKYQQADARDERFLVPALAACDLTAISGSLAVSTWPPEQRIVGSRSLRVHHLRVLLALFDLDRGEAAESLIARLAETVPGAVGRGEARDHARIRAAAQAELQVLAPLDEQERRAAAVRLAGLPAVYQVWGRPPLLEAQP